MSYVDVMADENNPSPKKLRCPACRSTKLSDEGLYASFENHARYPDWERGFLDYKDFTIGAERARFCFECGFMLLFAGREKLEKLKAGPLV